MAAAAVMLAFSQAAAQSWGAGASGVGGGPLTLSPESKADFQRYLKREYPLAFAVSRDGEHSGYYYCNVKNACLLADAKSEALADCRSNTPASSGACKIYAIAKDVVWRGAVSVRGPEKVKSASRASAAPAPNFKTPPRRPDSRGLAGSGPLVISGRVDRAYREYVKLKHPMAFAVSNDGEHSGWFNCKSKNACGEKKAALKSIAICNGKIAPGGAPCGLYSVKRKVIWQGPVAILPGAQADEALRAALPPPPVQPVPSVPSVSKKSPEDAVNPRGTKAFKDLEEEINKARNGK
ncbi:MAG TPA: hypothetical protein ENI79_06825 [Rhodospirillales bacterium]|nr:hypothetical protein [Rhodospirillales bacterium]